MFDSNRPQNNLESLPLKDFDYQDGGILSKSTQTNFRLGQLNGLISRIPNPDLLLTPLIVSEAVFSSQIESINSTLADQLQVELTGRRLFTSEQKETKRYKEALLFGYRYIQQKGRFDLELIELLQQTLNPQSLIEYQKKKKNKLLGFRDKEPAVIVHSLSNKILWTPPRGRQNILKLLNNWINWANNLDDGIDILIKNAILHARFEAIHPFIDGNGRVGRILFVLYLIYRGLLQYPAIFVSGYILQTRTYYYAYLQEGGEKNQYRNLVIYLLEAILKKAESAVNTVQNILELQDNYEHWMKTELPKIHSQKMIAFLFSNCFYTNKSICSGTGISRNTASKYLSLLTKNDLIKPYSSNKEKIYYNPTLLSLL